MRSKRKWLVLLGLVVIGVLLWPVLRMAFYEWQLVARRPRLKQIALETRDNLIPYPDVEIVLEEDSYISRGYVFRQKGYALLTYYFTNNGTSSDIRAFYEDQLMNRNWQLYRKDSYNDIYYKDDICIKITGLADYLNNSQHRDLHELTNQRRFFKLTVVTNLEILGPLPSKPKLEAWLDMVFGGYFPCGPND